MTEEQAPSLPVLSRPSEPLRPVVMDAAGMAACIGALQAGTGPIGIDTERAQSFRYSARAYLIQLRRKGAGTWLIDPIAFAAPGEMADLSALAAAVPDTWILHAASQDLPCLVQVGMVPRTLFDTERAARLLGMPRVALGTLVEQACGVRLLKEHSAADWSRRPVPTDWLLYAALDVELLAELREWLLERLIAAGKLEWAEQEFAALVADCKQPAIRRPDPWRRTSGIHKVRTERGLAVVAELWTSRDEIARTTDKAPGKVLPDAAITEIAGLVRAGTKSLTASDLDQVKQLRHRNAARYRPTWQDAIGRAMALPRAALPPMRLEQDGPPQLRSWETRNPAAHARWQAVRPKVVALAEQLEVPVENLISPDALRRVLWSPPAPADEPSLAAEFAHLGARPWQIEHVVPVVAAAWP